ncbi:MAG: enzyme of heme biosynthesis, partial [Gammaproteobacteria bacterium]|nr:enzyme of heme biosynthesis [Gammaproteobacteria bacterium]NIT63852.1 enzyme of heme biosynthesis [Gammaproteobacteria bacterium]NIV20856.1 enzyme of heme biosynthesis [Gammaproteobacteria bacterium]NIY32432.1 enzyme of heme biosynthesis [Gammaproteobacteria bacterium]
MQNSLEALHTELGRGRREWAIAEIEYYLRIANQRLQLLRDVDTATTALKLADQRLRALGDPALYEVRQR